MIEHDGVTVAHDLQRSTTTLTDANRNHAFELDHGGRQLNPDRAERAMFQAYFLGGSIGLLGFLGAERIRVCH
jgi:hypothetical protein